MNTVVRMDLGADDDAVRTARVTARHERLVATDSQYRAAMPLEAIGQLKKDSTVRMGQLIAAVMEACADRPALGRRATAIQTDSAGRRSLRLLDHFDTMTYGQVWADVRALASVFQHDEHAKVRPGELVCILGFAGAGYVIADLAATYVGAVSVPLQTNAPIPTLAGIFAEAQPRCLATSIECLDTAVEIVLSGHRPASLVVFEYCADDDDQRDCYERAKARLVAAGAPTRLETIQAICQRGRALSAPTLFVPGPTEDPLMTIYYTSGSTGSPKGAMLGERMSSIAWRAPDVRPMITVNYMPMNHSFGRILAFRTLAAGGTCYFAAKSDLSTLFDDVQRVRPTFINLVTRICEMIQQRYQAELAARGRAARPADVEVDVRERQFGGRLMAAAFGAAPMSAELHTFIERCLDVGLPNGYGATEIMGVTMNNKVMRPPIIDWKLVDVPELGYFRTDKPYPRGELLVKSHTMMQGYYKKPDITASVFDKDGYYKTGDVMAQIGPDELVYIDRRNNVQKLAQGEFVAIAQLEATFTAGHPLIRQVFLYGTSDRAFLLAVVVPNREALAREGIDPADTDSVKSRLREAIQTVAHAEHLQSYEVPRDFIVELEPFSADNGLLTGVGKTKRPALKERYGPALDSLYDEIAAKQSGELEELRRKGRDAPVLETLIRAVEATLGIEEIDTSSAIGFGDLGGDSLSALSLSLLLEEIYGLEVPVGVITHPAGNLRKLADYIEQARKPGVERPTFTSVHGRDATTVLAADLTLEKFIDDATLDRAMALAAIPDTPARTVLLTGANGYLGRFLCLEWLERLAGTDGQLVCIVRGADAAEARQRIVDAFDTGDAGLLSRFQSLAEKHLEVLAGDLAEHHLGLGEETWRRLAKAIDVIVHPAALVNHVLPYSQLFGPNVVGTAELIRLALSEKLKRFVNVSTVAVAFAGSKPIEEDADVRVAIPTRSLRDTGYANGYATSKWAAEILLREANARFGIPICNFRSDMILAHSRYRGQLNVPDMFTRWIFSIVRTGLAPRSFYRAPADRAHYDGLPVDFTAASVVALGESTTRGFHTFHVVNPHDDGISMDDFVEWIAASGQKVQRVEDYDDWFARFETALKALPEKQRHQSFLPLLHQLRQPMPATPGAAVSASYFHETVRRLGVASLKDIPHLSERLIAKYIADLQTVGMLGDSQ